MSAALPVPGRTGRSGDTLGFSFDGRRYKGRAGDTLAAALLANGVHLMGRSFKYHRPRGVLSLGSDEPNALVEVDRGGGRRTPNLRATQVELHDGLVARSQNRWPHLGFDVGAVADGLASLIPAGFYYKTFMWPAGAWSRLYEPLIRRAAGLGRAPDQADPDRYAARYAHCDVLVVGAGPAGLAAATRAAASGARVILCDEQARFGGSLLAERRARIGGLTPQAWVAARLGELAACANVRLLPRTTAFGWYADNLLGLAERVTDHLADPDPALPRERLWQVRAKQVVIAAGSIERPLVFPGNDRPGIMLADAARSYATRYGAPPGRRAVLVTACDTVYGAALDLREAGVTVALVADLRATADGALPRLARDAGIRTVCGATVLGTSGRLRVASVSLRHAGRTERVACDVLGMSGGWTPSIHLFSQSRGRPRFAAELGAFVPDISAQAERSVGACAGIFTLAEVIADGAAGGAQAAAESGHAAAAAPAAAPAAAEVTHAPAAAGFSLGGAATGRAFVDFQNDVTAKDLRLAAREGFRSIEHVKRYTTTGMATDQGKTSNLNALAIVADATGQNLAQVGLTTFRPPYTPVTFGTLAGSSRGALFDPVRTTPIHAWAQAQGAVFEDVGLWKRARYFPQGSEDMASAVARECRAVRRSVGLFDASTLGKIEVAGPDAAEFMNRMYVNAWSKLKPGHCRYGLMLGENGFLLDDGVAGRLSETRFHVTTTTGGAPRVLSLMEDYLQTEWPELRVWLTSTTEQWAVIAVQGPRAREVLAPLLPELDISAAAMPHMALREGSILGVAMRLFRVSFTGELGFEINVPADFAEAVWTAVWDRVQACGGTAYGTETMHVLRAEKGYVIVGQESDGTVTLNDLGLDWAIGKAKRDFVGKRSLSRQEMVRPDRRQLVGLLAEDQASALEEGAQVLASADAAAGGTTLGHVTSAYGSTSVGHPIALALVARGRDRTGELLHVQSADGTVPVRVVAPVFYDPEGEKLNG